MRTHKTNCKQIEFTDSKWHSAICEALNENYLYARRYAIYQETNMGVAHGQQDNYARAICQLIEKEYERELTFAELVRIKPAEV